MASNSIIPGCEHKWVDVLDENGIVIVHFCSVCRMKAEIIDTQTNEPFESINWDHQTFAEAVRQATETVNHISDAFRYMAGAFGQAFRDTQKYNEQIDELKHFNCRCDLRTSADDEEGADEDE